MNKEDLLIAITESSAIKKITREEVLSAFEKGLGEVREPARKPLSFINILYFIGGLIIFIGIILFVHQQWNILNTPARIAVSLGSGIAAYIVALLISRTKGFTGVASAFYLLFNLVTPVGIYITLHEYSYTSDALTGSTIIYLAMFIATVVSIFISKQSLFRVFAIIFGSMLYFSETHTLLQGSSLNTAEMLEYRFLLLGTSYLLLGYALRQKFTTFTAWLYSVGTFMFLGASFALGGYKPDVTLIWEVGFVGICFAMMGLSVYLKSRAMLIIASLYLMAYILKLTAEYFSDTVGWPLALIGAGFVLIGIGYGTFRINQQYLRQA
jgi:hypothetical protein